MKRLNGVMAVAAFGILLSSGAAFAKHPCHIAAEKFCKGIKPGEGRIHACLNEHKEQLGPKCTEKLDKWDEMESHKK